MLTIGDLKSIIEEAEEQGADGDAEVRVAMQPSWPFEHALSGCRWAVSFASERDLMDRPEEHDFEDFAAFENARRAWRANCSGEAVLYLAESQQVGYLNPEAAELVGWS